MSVPECFPIQDSLRGHFRGRDGVKVEVREAPEAVRLHQSAQQFSQRVDVLPWDEQVSEHYGEIRASLTSAGITLAPLDLMIFAHAAAVEAVLVTDDRAFLPAAAHIKTLDAYSDFELENWAVA